MYVTCSYLQTVHLHVVTATAQVTARQGIKAATAAFSRSSARLQPHGTAATVAAVGNSCKSKRKEW